MEGVVSCVRAFKTISREDYEPAKIKWKEHKLSISAVHYSTVPNIAFII